MNKISLAAVTLALPMLTACGSNDEPKPDPAPGETTTHRTVLVYMVANNDLGGTSSDAFDKSDLAEMQAAAMAGDLQGGRLLAYHATANDIVLKEITANGVDTLKIYDDDELSVSIKRMREVIADAKKLAPAEDFGLVLWSHATGWLQDGISESSVKTAMRSFGLDGRSKMNITSMAKALEDADLSFIYFDCCYMGSVEVVYEMRDCAPYIVCSPAEDPAAGMPYDLALRHIFSPRMDTEDAMVAAANETFNYYNDVFKKGDCPCTMTVVRTGALEDLAEITRQIYERSEMSYKPLYEYQKFQTSSTCYYYDFGDYVESISTDDALLERFKQALDDAIAYKNSTPWVWSSFPITRYSGLSSYIFYNADASQTKNYHTLEWYNDVASTLLK